MESTKEYLSHYYEHTCDKCKQAIKKNTPYHLFKRQSQGKTEFYRIHVICPNDAG
jgi:hypothetical protein